MNKKRLIAAIAVFMCVMTVFTVITRVRVSYLTPVVSISYGKKDSLTYEIRGEGEIRYKEESVIYAVPGLIIDEIYVDAGDRINKGGVIYQYNMEELTNRLIEKLITIQEYEYLLKYSGAGDYIHILENRLLLLNKEVKEYERLIQLDGKEEAVNDGYIIEFGLQKGVVTTGNETVRFGYGEGEIIGSIQTEYNELLRSDTEFEVSVSGYPDAVQARIKDSTIHPDTKDIQVVLTYENGDFPSGTKVYYEASMKSEKYEMTLPLEALHDDGRGGKYVFIVEERFHILGNEKAAVRTDVTVIAQNNNFAAIEGPISRREKVINGSDRSIYDDCRIKVQE